VRGRIAAIADVQLRLGDISPLEAAAVQVEAARARDEAQRASRAAESSRDRLLTLLGLAGGTSSQELTLAPAAPSRAELPGLDTLLREALAARPELRAVELAMEAAGRRAGVARSEILTLSALLDATGSGREGFEMGPGLTLEIPLFGRHEGRLAPAEAELEVEARRYVATREKIALEVRQARTALVGARESLTAWESSVLPAMEQSLARREKAREAGDASRLEGLAAPPSRRRPRATRAERRAEAALGHAVGRRSAGTTAFRQARP
jgi:cobalt-zinc-cadmium efflux system outer membrane protein